LNWKRNKYIKYHYDEQCVQLGDESNSSGLMPLEVITLWREIRVDCRPNNTDIKRYPKAVKLEFGKEKI
jgi:hypothetical protein